MEDGAMQNKPKQFLSNVCRDLKSVTECQSIHMKLYGA